MKRFKYAVVVTGFMEVPDDATARQAALSGVAITGALLTTRPDLAVDVAEVPTGANDGSGPVPFPRPVEGQGH